MVHRGRGRHRRRQEGLDLIGAEAVALQPERQLQHVLVGGAGVGGDEVRDQVLLLAGLPRVAVEQLLESIVGADPGFIIFESGPVLDVLGRDLQIAADMVLRELLDVLGRRRPPGRSGRRSR